MARTPFRRFLDTTGDGTGTKDAIGNYAGGQSFRLKPATLEVYSVDRLIVQVTDAASPSADVYGNLAAALTNGVLILTRNTLGGPTISNITDGEAIKINAHWARFGRMEQINTTVGNSTIQAIIDFPEPLSLSGNFSENLEVILQDNMTGLVSQTFLAVGYEGR